MNLFSSVSSAIDSVIRRLRPTTTDDVNRLIKSIESDGQVTAAEKQSLAARLGDKFAPGAREQLESYLASTHVRLNDPPLPGKDAPNLTWTQVPGGQLYIDGISNDDVVQGTLADCYLNAALSSIAQKDPQAIRDAIKDNGDGTFTVRFFARGPWGQMTPRYVTVDSDLPAYNGTTSPAYAHGRNGKELWPAILEKAYAAFRGSYDAIGNGGFAGDVMTALTGTPSSSTGTSNAEAAWRALTEGTARGQAVTATTYGEEKKKKYENSGIYSWHTYSVLGTSVENGQRYVTLRNPWGYAEPGNDGKDDGTFKMKFEDFLRFYKEVEVGGRVTQHAVRPAPPRPQPVIANDLAARRLNSRIRVW